MFTLIYNNGQFNRPDTLYSFLQSNVGEMPLLQVDCIMPYPGSEGDFQQKVCDYLNCITPDINVSCLEMQICSSEGNFVKYMVLRVRVDCNYDNKRYKSGEPVGLS